LGILARASSPKTGARALLAIQRLERMKSVTAENLMQEVQNAFGKNKVPRLQMVTVPAWHTFDHYGQIRQSHSIQLLVFTCHHCRAAVEVPPLKVQ